MRMLFFKLYEWNECNFHIRAHSVKTPLWESSNVRRMWDDGLTISARKGVKSEKKIRIHEDFDGKIFTFHPFYAPPPPHHFDDVSPVEAPVGIVTTIEN